MKRVYNVIYRDLTVTTIFRNVAKRSRRQADILAKELLDKGWDVIIDEFDSSCNVVFDAPVVDIKLEKISL